MKKPIIPEDVWSSGRFVTVGICILSGSKQLQKDPENLTVRCCKLEILDKLKFIVAKEMYLFVPVGSPMQE